MAVAAEIKTKGKTLREKTYVCQCGVAWREHIELPRHLSKQQRSEYARNYPSQCWNCGETNTPR